MTQPNQPSAGESPAYPIPHRRSDCAKQQALNWFAGWSHAAGLKAIPEELQNDVDFLAGWRWGRMARKEAATSAETHYGIKFLTLKPAALAKPAEQGGKEAA